MDSSSQDKNLPATPRRLQKAREDGQVPRAQYLAHLAVLGGGMVMLTVLVPWGYERLRQVMRLSFSFDLDTIRHPESQWSSSRWPWANPWRSFCRLACRWPAWPCWPWWQPARTPSVSNP
jgi:hypothetical protein